MLSYIIDAMQFWDAVTDDIKGSFLKTDSDKGDIHINMEGEMVTILNYINLAYYKDFIYIYSHRKK